jgi:hypothetical protein
MLFNTTFNNVSVSGSQLYWWRKSLSYDQVGILLLLFGMTMLNIPRGCRGRDSMVFGFTTTYAIGVYHHKSC